MQETYAANSNLDTQVYFLPTQINSPAHLQVRMKDEEERCKDLYNRMTNFHNEKSKPLLRSSHNLWYRSYSQNLHLIQTYNTYLKNTLALEALNQSLSASSTISNVDLLPHRELVESAEFTENAMKKE